MYTKLTISCLWIVKHTDYLHILYIWPNLDIAFSKVYELLAPGGTHCDHMVIAEPYKTKFFEGLRATVLAHDNIFL